MRKQRQYLATYDDGHDCGSFLYTSEHRSGSKANLEDAYKEFEKSWIFTQAPDRDKEHFPTPRRNIVNTAR